MTWLTPYIEAWKEKMGGDPPTGPLARWMRRLERDYPPEDVLARWKAYLKEAHPMYANPARFSMTYGSWKPKQGLKELRDPLNEEGL